MLLLLSHLGAQPQGDVGWLHRLPYHPNQIVAQCFKVCFVPQPGGESIEGLSGIVLPTIEAPVYKGLNTSSQGAEQRCYHQGGDDDGELGLLFLAGERSKDYLGRRHAPEIHQRKHQRERAIDESAVYEDVYVVEAVAQDRYPYCDRNRRYKGYIECKPHSLEPEGGVYHSGDDVCKDSGASVCRSSVSKPFDLLTLHSYGTA